MSQSPLSGLPAADAFPMPDARHYLKAVRAFGRVQPVSATRAIFNTQGLKVIDKGVRIDDRLYERLLAHRLSEPVQECLTVDDLVDAREVWDHAQAVMGRAPFFGAMAAHDSLRAQLAQSMLAIPLVAPMAFSLSVLRETQPEGFEHAVMMALMCAHFAREGGATQHDTTMAATAGLLHDLGMLYIDPALLRSGKALDPSQRRHLYAHPLTAAAQLQPHHVYPREVVRAILEHHERLDGSGYPRGLSGDAISALGRSLSLAEVVTAMFAPERTHPVARVDLLLRLNPGQFDPTLVESVRRLIAAARGPVRGVHLLGGDHAEGIDATQAQADLAQLRAVPEMIERWRTLAAAHPTPAGISELRLFESVHERLDALERMLFEAGVGPQQLDSLSEQDRADPQLRVELSLLSGEARWQLRMAGLELRRRWPASSGHARLPQDLHDWVRSVDVLHPAPGSESIAPAGG